jgi:hypothetical protein
MRILCDQNVPRKYLRALEEMPDITAASVADVLSHDAADADIVAFAETNGWVIFTSDEDFFPMSGNCGLLVYDQLEDPTPGDVVTAIQRIRDAYESEADILETVPGNWV